MVQVFKVRKGELELVKPAKATPSEVKSLSDWDDREFLRYRVSCIMFYNSSAPEANDDLVERIKKALEEALVYYYPMAGRLKEQGEDKRLVVDCNAEGVGFVTADADVTLDQLGPLRPPFPCMAELLDNPDNNATLGCPVFVMQVTRLMCGGFIVAFCFNHVMSDMGGATQFVTAISELACGAHSPSILPVWQRELLNTRSHHPLLPPPPQKKRIETGPFLEEGMTYRSFFFGAQEVEAIRAHLPECNRDRYTSFELIAAFVFHCRALSVEHELEEKVHACFTVNARSKFVETPIPSGYYGNVSFTTGIIGPIHTFHDLQFVVEELKKAKENFTEDSARLQIDQARCSGPRSFIRHTYAVADLSRVGLSSLDFGFGKPVYAGTVCGKNPHIISAMVASTNAKGHKGRLIAFYMPKSAMDKFDYRVRTLLGSI